jgi:class 3 adenylate cyclase/putative methionine-R-sulfoxide reductase with GAF domain
MKKRSRAGGEPIRGRRSKTPKRTRRNAPKGQARSKLSPAIEETEVARLSRELTDERRQRVATSEVLRLLSGSHGNLNHLFDTILANATTLCQANFGTLSLCEGDAFRIVAMHNVPPGLAELRRREPLVRAGPLLRMAETKRLLHITDYTEYVASHPADSDAAAFAKLTGVRTTLEVPMLKEDDVVGAIVIYRKEVRRFDETATSEVLQVISTSSSDLVPVFATILEKAVSICDAKLGTLYLREKDRLRLIATHDVPPAFAETQGHEPFLPAPHGMLDAVMRSARTVHLADLTTARSYIERDPRMVNAVEVGGIRTVVGVPLIKDNELIGLIGIYRQEVRPFAEKQIALLTNFAAQAVIAIENARLLNELRQRTTDLTEALEQQTATSEVLQVISSSPGLLEEVFASMLEKAVRICDAAFGNIYRWDGTSLHLVANHNTPPAWVEYRKREPYRADNPFGIARMINSKAPVHVTDLSDEYYTKGVQLGEIKTFLAVPMLSGDDLIGAFIVSRKEVRPFTDKQIGLVHNFAAQAVIAIENARLLKELRERTTEVERLNKHLEQRVADQVSEIERMSRLRRFLPPQVADLIVTSGAEKQLESHRREITALFCDLRGFTGFSESADPEDVMTLLREYHEAIGESIIKYSGTLERYAGDGVMVVFNDPVPVENPTLQAVLMALEMREAIGALTETWRRWGHEIGFGIGIAHGFATLGTIGFEGRFDYAAIGTVSNVASRLCDEAKPGQILISPRVLTKVENAVKVEPVGEFALKGIRRPLAAYNVVAAISQREH